MNLRSPSSVFTLIIIFITNIAAQTPCDENEVYTNCSSSSCFEETCVDVLFAKPSIKKCTRDCKRGCKCMDGYFRNHDGRCVSELTCIMCGHGENWLEFGDNDDNYEKMCIDLVDNSFDNEFENDAVPTFPTEIFGNEFERESEPTFPPGIFDENEPNDFLSDSEPDDIEGGMCSCAKNLYRSFDGLCVSKESCLECGVNEIYELCGSSSCWEYNCDDALVPLRERLMRPCTLDCRSGCKCHPGFYRDTTTGQCVSAAMCLE